MPTFDGKSEKFELFEDISKRNSKFTIRLLKTTESITSILSWGGMRYKHLTSLMAQPERNWEKLLQFSEGSMWNPSRWQQQNTNSRNFSSTQQIKI